MDIPFYEQDGFTLYNGDCVKVMKGMTEASVDLVVTSPPYNIGIDYASYSDDLPWGEYLSWCGEWLAECRRLLKPDGRIAVNVLVEMGIDGNSRRVSPMIELYEIMSSLGFTMCGLPMWTDRHRVKNTAWGSYLSASCPYVYNPMEVIILAHNGEKKKLSSGVSTVTKDDFVMGTGGLWDFRDETAPLTKCCFPVGLPKLCIDMFTYEGDTVLDPFSGSGTTGIACKMSNRRYVGIELDKSYCEISVRRMQEKFSQLYLF